MLTRTLVSATNRVLVTLATACVALCFSATAQADVIYSNFGPGGAYNPALGYGASNIGSSTIGLPPFSPAFTFTTPGASNYTLQQIVAPFGSDGTAGPLTVNLILRLDDAGSPGAIVETLSYSGALSSFGVLSPPITFTSALAPTLLANTTYWLQAAVPNSTIYTVYWETNSIGALSRYAFLSSSPPYIYPEATQAAFSISGTPVPISTPPPNYSLSLTTLNFGTIQTNATSTAQTIALTSTGGPLTISSLVMSGANPGDFLITGNTCTTVVIAGGGCSFGVAFSPIAANTRSASLQVLSNAPTQAVVLQGVGVLAPSTKVDTKCVDAFSSQNFDTRTSCGVINTLRTRFGVNREDASNDELYAWLQNDANKSAASALIENEKLGDMVRRYLAGDTWDSKIYRSQVAAIYNGSTTLISLITKLKTLLDVLGRENPVVTFVGRIGPIIEIVQTAVDAYIEVNKVLQGDDKRKILAEYIRTRCGTENRVHCPGDDSQTLTMAQDIVRVDYLPLVQSLLCKALSSATCTPIPESDILKYLNSLELSYQAFRLVGYSEDSPLIRQELGKKLVSVIKNPAQ